LAQIPVHTVIPRSGGSNVGEKQQGEKGRIVEITNAGVNPDCQLSLFAEFSLRGHTARMRTCYDPLLSPRQ
jgi:hypothetical protein